MHTINTHKHPPTTCTAVQMAQYIILDTFSIVTFVMTVAMESPLDILANTASVAGANRSSNTMTY
eukprot:14592833-Ditylum_brightwellii.AAC.1